MNVHAYYLLGFIVLSLIFGFEIFRLRHELSELRLRVAGTEAECSALAHSCARLHGRLDLLENRPSLWRRFLFRYGF